VVFRVSLCYSVRRDFGDGGAGGGFVNDGFVGGERGDEGLQREVVDCGSPEIVEGFLRRFRLGLGASTESWATTVPVRWHKPASRWVKLPVASRAPRRLLPSKAITRRPPITLVWCAATSTPRSTDRADARMPDPRRIRHALPGVLAIALTATLAGARSFVAIAEWAADATPQVAAGLGVTAAVPSESTIRRCLGLLAAGSPPANLAARLECQPTRPAAGRSRRRSTGWAMMAQRAQRTPVGDVTGVKTVIITSSAAPAR